MDNKKRGWVIGCSIAAVVIGSGAISCALVFGFVVYKTAPSVERGFAFVGETVEVTQEAMRTPGTSEMRAAGCDDAVAFTPALLRRMMVALEPDGGAEHAPTQPILACVVRDPHPTPACGEVVRAFASAQSVPPAETVIRISGPRGQSDIRCQGVFAPDGTRLSDIRENDERALGQTGGR